MYFEKIHLSNYRNYVHLDLALQSGVHIFIGPNGQGKTNLIEALYLLTKGSSFRPGKIDIFKHRMMRFEDVSYVHAQVYKSGTRHQLKAQIGQNSKNHWLNSKKLSSTLLASKFPSVLFSPESLSAIKSAPEERRQLVDDFIAQAFNDGASLIAEYRKTLRTRNRLLRDVKTGNMSKSETIPILGSLNPRFLELATELSFRRIESIQLLKNELQDAMCDISSLKNVDISVDYVISSKSSIDWPKDRVYHSLVSRLNELQGAELESGISLVGPHKHDIQFMFAGEDSRYFCSQGQQRALILSFKIAQVLAYHRLHGVYPILFLDDVLSELDPMKQKKLVRFLKQLDSQIFLTTTDLKVPHDFADKSAGVYWVEDGKIKIDEITCSKPNDINL